MTPLAWLLLAIGGSFVTVCFMLWRRLRSDEKKDAQKNATRRLSDYAAQVKPTPPQLIGRNGRSNRTGAPINRRTQT